jgi:hypothetical protein
MRTTSGCLATRSDCSTRSTVCSWYTHNLLFLSVVHTVMGSSGFGMSSTYGSLFDASCTTCQLSVDKSAYWVPSLYYVSKDGKNFTSVTQNGGSLMYYLFRRDNDQIPLVAFPEGFRMVTGSPYYRGDQGTLESQALSWACIDYSIAGTPQTGYIPDRNCPDNLRMQLVFPSCWDGVNLDSSDHKSHGICIHSR